MEHLVFQLYGPMTSWGEIAVGERRSSSVPPSKSAIVGLLGAALGIRRDEEERHRQLAAACGMAVRIDARGELLRDYHTAQASSAKGKRKFFTRADELSSPELHTILSQRDYRVDACYTVALWSRISQPPYLLRELGKALDRPCFVLYLGRKSCPLSLPVHAQLVDAGTLREAFSRAAFPVDLLDGLTGNVQEEYMWEEHPTPGLEASMVYPRRDEVLSRRRWQFKERDEYYAIVPREGG